MAQEEVQEVSEQEIPKAPRLVTLDEAEARAKEQPAPEPDQPVASQTSGVPVQTDEVPEVQHVVVDPHQPPATQPEEQR